VQVRLKVLELGMKGLKLGWKVIIINKFNELTHATSTHGKRFLPCFTMQGMLLDFHLKHAGKNPKRQE